MKPADPNDIPPYTSSGDIYDALDQLYGKLHLIQQQLRFYTSLTQHDMAGQHLITMESETLHVTMSHLADQVEAVMKYVDALPRF